MTSYEHVKSGVISRILRNEMAPDSRYDDAALEAYFSHLGFLMSSLNRPEFDPLTPSPDTPERGLQALRYIFEPQSWTLTTENVMGKQRPVFSFAYDPTVDALIEPLVTGQITPELHRLLEKIHYDGWDRGFVKAVVEDLRYGEPSTFVKRLRLGSETSLLEQRRFMESHPSEDRLEVERLMLLQTRGEICTDPSPEVARYWSAVDWRAKMWRPAPPRTLPPVPHITHPPPSNAPRIENTATQSFEIAEDAQADWFNLVDKRRQLLEAARKAKQQTRPGSRR